MKVVPLGRKKCIWMEAGVVSYKLCDNNYDCSTCLYDHAMQAKVERQRESPARPMAPAAETFNETWVERMMRLPASRRKCRYMLTGEVSHKICANAYECGNCAFDQMMQERIQSEVLPVHSRIEVGGFVLAEDFYYHEGHTWARPEYGGRVRVGLDDFARRLLGRVQGVELPDLGGEVKQGEVGLRLRRNGHGAGVLSPVDGIVVRQNERIFNHPELIHESPYEEGWLFIVEPIQLRKNLKGLYFGEAAKGFLREERERLISMMDQTRLAADGGAPAEDLYQELQKTQWERIVKAFLRS
jgi:glycine cleavage system H lipoate-binding protein